MVYKSARSLRARSRVTLASRPSAPSSHQVLTVFLGRIQKGIFGKLSISETINPSISSSFFRNPFSSKWRPDPHHVAGVKIDASLGDRSHLPFFAMSIQQVPAGSFAGSQGPFNHFIGEPPLQ